MDVGKLSTVLDNTIMQSTDYRRKYFGSQKDLYTQNTFIYAVRSACLNRKNTSGNW